jgi:hypothetical protein
VAAFHLLVVDRGTPLISVDNSANDALDAALLEKETIDGAEVKRLVDVAAGREVRAVSVPRLGPDTDPGGTDASPSTPSPSRRPRRPADDGPDVVDETPTGKVPRVV